MGRDQVNVTGSDKKPALGVDAGPKEEQPFLAALAALTEKYNSWFAGPNIPLYCCEPGQ